MWQTMKNQKPNLTLAHMVNNLFHQCSLKRSAMRALKACSRNLTLLWYLIFSMSSTESENNSLTHNFHKSTQNSYYHCITHKLHRYCNLVIQGYVLRRHMEEEGHIAKVTVCKDLPTRLYYWTWTTVWRKKMQRYHNCIHQSYQCSHYPHHISSRCWYMSHQYTWTQLMHRKYFALYMKEKTGKITKLSNDPVINKVYTRKRKILKKEELLKKVE